jgi:hypothetical protein
VKEKEMKKAWGFQQLTIDKLLSGLYLEVIPNFAKVESRK